MRNERNSLRQAAITAGILAALGVCTLGGDQPRVWAAEPSNNTAQAEAKTAAAQGVQAAADETENDGMSFDLEGVTVEAKRPDWEAKLSPGTVTVIRPDDYKGEQKDLPDLLKMVPGVHVRELNGKGQYTTVSVRGSTAAQVGVFVDGVLFNLGGDAAADISTIPVHNVERIEVYRGYIPARFGGTFMGGVINVVTKRPTKANVQASFGKSSMSLDPSEKLVCVCRSPGIKRPPQYPARRTPCTRAAVQQKGGGCRYVLKWIVPPRTAFFQVPEAFQNCSPARKSSITPGTWHASQPFFSNASASACACALSNVISP